LRTPLLRHIIARVARICGCLARCASTARCAQHIAGLRRSCAAHRARTALRLRTASSWRGINAGTLRAISFRGIAQHNNIIGARWRQHHQA